MPCVTPPIISFDSTPPPSPPLPSHPLAATTTSLRLLFPSPSSSPAHSRAATDFSLARRRFNQDNPQPSSPPPRSSTESASPFLPPLSTTHQGELKKKTCDGWIRFSGWMG
ncbi:hypothetical protein Tsubulata_049167 [Turnera subulata]|uniref:Uncharacterized protein n=1 Tax=Turnera subulata TaxID=218843 RepID=A0A9Q0FVT2_9ROSI|nr:hypothetical protein Tsubulata_049167 [Turnera subulata]